MARWQASRWLEVCASHDGAFSVLDSGTLGRLTEQMPEPHQQYPMLWVFLGSSKKAIALRGMFADNAITRTASDGGIHLWSDVTSLTSSSPILFVDSDLWTQPTAQRGRRQWRDYPLAWPASSASEVKTLLIVQLLSGLADVVCVWVDDFPFGENLATFLANYRTTTSLPVALRPRLIIVHDTDTKLPHNWAALDPLSETFSHMVAVPLAGDGSFDADQQYDHLKTLIRTQSQEIQRLRRKNIAQLAAVHLNKVFQLALRHFSETREQPFDLIRASRGPDGIPPDIGLHVDYFHHVCMDADLTDLDCAKSIASALIMDHYRPEMPPMNPELVYQTLYRPKIALKHHGHSPPSDVLLDVIEREMINQFYSLQNVATPSVVARRDLITQNRQYSGIKSNRLCLYCLIRPAQHATVCDHPFCDLCARLFGVPAVDREFRFRVEHCLFCQTHISLEMDILPPSMDPTILAIDGGGVRVAMPLQFLALVQEHLGEHCRLQDLVDLHIGPSAGGLAGIGLFDKQLPVADCAEMFDRLAHVVFSKKRRPALPWLPQQIFGQIRQWASWFMHDSCYDGSVFDTVLKDLFGSHSFFHGNPTVLPGVSRTKIGVIATDIANKTRTVVIGNFNATRNATDDGDYHVIRPMKIEDEPKAWEAGKATASPPFFFTPASLKVGTFQDGGLTNNFAGGIARRVSRTIWTRSEEPARMLSLGTGKFPQHNTDSSPHFRHVFRDGFLRRAFSAWMTSMDSDSRWREMNSQLDQSIASNFRRVDVVLEGESMSLDAIEMMDHYRNLVIRNPETARLAKVATLDLITARFFFALDRVSTNRRRPLRVYGAIRCKGPIRVILPIMERLAGGSFEFVTDNQRLGSRLSERDICPLCGRFCRPVTLITRSHDQPIAIYLKSSTNHQWRINIPSTLARLMKREERDVPFGGEAHGKAGTHPCAACDSGCMPFRGERPKRGSSVCVEERKRKRVCIVDEVKESGLAAGMADA